MEAGDEAAESEVAPDQGTSSNLQENEEEDDESFMTLLDRLGGERVFEE